MKLNIFIIDLLFFSLSFLGQNKLPEYKYYPVIKKNEIKKYELKEGRKNHDFLLDNNKKWSFNISVPKINKNEKVPLIIALHWAGNKKANLEYSNCLAFPSFEFLNGIIISPSSDGMLWIDPNNQNRVIKLVKQAIKYWPIDKEKVIITGYSNGAIGAWHYSLKYPKLFRVSLPVAGYYKKPRKVKTYILHGEKDELFDEKIVETSVIKSNQKKNTITYKKNSRIFAFYGVQIC